VTDPAALAAELAEAARRGDDLASLPGAGDPEEYREAAELVRAANRAPGGDPALLLDDGELRRVDRQFRRADALAALYEAEQRRVGPDATALSEAAADLALGVWEERGDLDRAIGEASTGWRVERMPPVDRTILRVALWELRHRPTTPVAVVIAEAVRLAKAYSTERSGAFVNGVLGRLARAERPDGE
jgi:N utilization substance protein B